MILRRLAFALGLLSAVLASQLPEFTHQYRQRLGGAIDELTMQLVTFDGEASAQALSRAQGIARLEANGDLLVRQRGASLRDVAARKDRLERQRNAFAVAGPLSAYTVLAEDFDPTIARHAVADFVPAVPVTAEGFVTAGLGFLVGWSVVRLLAVPLRRLPTLSAA